MQQRFYYNNDAPGEPGASMEAGSTGEAKPQQPTEKKKKHGSRVEYLSGEGKKKTDDHAKSLGIDEDKDNKNE